MKPSFQEQLIERESNKVGLRGKINAKCIECIFDPYDVGTWRMQVEQCTSSLCPLFKVRPSSCKKGKL